MLFRALLLLLLLAAPPLHAAEDGREPEKPQRGFVSRSLDYLLFRRLPWQPEQKPEQSNARTRHLELQMEVSPNPLKLSETRQLKVILKLRNRSKGLVQLHFLTTQRIEILIRDQAGRMVTQWSEDQAFANNEGFVSINPGERVEYTGSVGTRDLIAGREYVVEGFFPKFDELKARKRITPER